MVNAVPTTGEGEALLAGVSAEEGKNIDDGFPLPLLKPGYTESALRLLIHADPGIGKTYLAGTAADSPETSPVLFIDTEGGTLTIRNRTDINVVRVRSWNDIQKLIVYLRRTNKYKCIVIDSLTELQKTIMSDILKEKALAGNLRDPDVPEMRDWGKNSERVRKAVRAFRDLPDCHVIFTCLSKIVKNERTGTETVKPSLPGQLADDVAGFLDVVGWLHIVREKQVDPSDAVEGEPKKVAPKAKEVIKRRILFQPAIQVIAKDRSDNLGIYMEDPTIPKIVDKILGRK